MRMINQEKVEIESKGHFLALAAQAMRRVLVDHARTKQREKRGGQWQRLGIAGAVVAEDEHLVLEGILAGSIPLAAGDRVQPGDKLGRLAGGPLTIYLRDPEGEGIPLSYSLYLADEQEIERGTPIRGQRVRSVASSR